MKNTKEKLKCNGCLKPFEGDLADKIIGLCPKCSKALDKHIKILKEVLYQDLTLPILYSQ